MKKFAAILLTIIIIISSSMTAFSSSVLSFSLGNVEAKKGRLVTIDMSACFDNGLCAALFEFTFDDSVIEFRKIKCTSEDSGIETNCVGNKLKAVFLNAYGEDISKEKVIFTITFKAENVGESYIDYTVSDCIDADVKPINSLNCISGKIKVTGASGSSSKVDDTASSYENSTSESGISSDSKRPIDETSAVAEFVDLGEVNPFKIDKGSYVFSGIIIGLLCAIFTFVIFIIIKKCVKRNKKQDGDNKDENIDDDDEFEEDDD